MGEAVSQAMGEAVTDLVAAVSVLGGMAIVIVGVSACCCWTMRVWCAPAVLRRQLSTRTVDEAAVDEAAAVEAADPAEPAGDQVMTPPPLVVLKDTRGSIALVKHPDGGNSLGMRQPAAVAKWV